MVLQILSILSVALVLISPVHSHISHAFSSQHVSRHDGHAHAVYVPKHEHGHDHGHIDYHAHPKYDFKYQVHDPHTGDYKSHHEERDGDVVKGYYEFKEPDGTLRRVEYHADKHTGYHATVKHATEHIVPKHHHHD